MSPVRRVLTAAPVLALLALSGCGGSATTSTSESSPSPAAPTTATATTSAPSSPSAAGASLSLAADPEGQLRFDKSSLTAKAGAVKIDFSNMASIAHNLTVESSSGATLGATPSFQGETKTLSLNLKPGTYKFYCSIPGHRQAGMEGTLTVS